MEGEVVQMHEILSVRQKEHTDEQGNVHGTLQADRHPADLPGRSEAYGAGPSHHSLRSQPGFVKPMIATELWLIYALVFGAALLGVQGSLLAVVQGAARAEGDQPAPGADRPARPIPRKSWRFCARSGVPTSWPSFPSLQSFKELIVQSGVRLSGRKLLLSVGHPCRAVLLPASDIATRVEFFGGRACCPSGRGLDLSCSCKRARRRRIAAFSEQLPDALDVIVRGLRAGHPFRVALGLVAREMPDPVGSEFGIVADEIMFGLEQSAAIDNLCPGSGKPISRSFQPP